MNADLAGRRRRLVPAAPPCAAFTLVELLVVMAIIAILAGIVIGVHRYAAQRARDAKVDMEELEIRSALEEYRTVYGEYPVIGSLQHYFNDFEPDPATSANVPATNRTTDLADNNALETLPFTIAARQGQWTNVGAITVDHSLTFPLKERPELDGREPFMDFPRVTICFLVWRHAIARNGYIGTNIYYVGEDRTPVERECVKGDPVNRVVPYHPRYGHRWAYACSDGTTYTLTHAQE